MRNPFPPDIQDLMRREREIREQLRLVNNFPHPLGKDYFINSYEMERRSRSAERFHSVDIHRQREIDKQIKESLRYSKQFLDINRLEAKLPKFDLPSSRLIERDLIRENVANRNNYDSQLSRIGRELRENYFDDRNIRNSIRQERELINSSFGTAVYAASLRENEINSLRQNIEERAKIASLNFSNPLTRDALNYFDRVKRWDEIDALKNTFAGRLAIEFRDVLEQSTNRDEAFERINSIIEEKVGNQSGFANNQLLNTILSVLALVIAIYGAVLQTYQTVESKKSSEEQKVQVEEQKVQNAEQKAQNDILIQLMKQVVENTAHKSSDTNNELLYEVQRETELKASPSFKAETTNILIPKSQARILFRNHKWVYVECFNYLEGVSQYGWVNKKYLIKIK